VCVDDRGLGENAWIGKCLLQVGPASQRVFAAMMGMRKIDIAAIDAARRA
jgi:hypothetical protein